MEQTPSTPDLYKHAARSGAICAAIGIVVTVLLYVIDLGLLADWKVGLFFLALYIGLVIYFGINYRNEAGGYLSYGKAFQHGYITMLIGGLLSTIFSILLFHVIDPTIPQKLTDITIEKTEEMLSGFGMSQDAIDQAMEKAAADTPGRFTVVGQLTQFAWGFLVYAVMSAITAAFVKRNQPETM
jgi:hypothetical protein